MQSSVSRGEKGAWSLPASRSGRMRRGAEQRQGAVQVALGTVGRRTHGGVVGSAAEGSQRARPRGANRESL